MNKKVVRDITILYNDDYKDKINNIVKIIYDNYHAFINCLEFDTICLFDTDMKEVHSITDIDSFIDKVFIDSYLSDENVDGLFEDNFIPGIYKLYLFKTVIKENDIKNIEDYSVNEILKCMAERYYLEKDDIPKFIDYLKIAKEEVTNEIVEWYKDKERFNVYKEIIMEQLTFFSEDKDILLDNINTVSNFVTNITPEELSNYNKTIDDKDREYISREKCFKLFNKYLEYINAPLDWIIEFNNLVKDKKIIESNKSNCINGVININFNNNLDDLVKLAHEFAHHISKNIVDYNENSLIEFPSIYHEINMQNFLVLNGFNEDDATSFNRYRFRNELNNYVGYYPILRDIYCYIINNKLDENEMIKQKIFDVKKVSEIIKYDYDCSYEEIKEFFNKEIDSRIKLLISDPKKLVTCFQYFLDLLLASKVIEKQKEDNNICDIMSNITEDYGNYNIKDILELLNIKDFYKVKK